MTERASISLAVAMEALSRLAGWRTVPDPDDHAVVRLALNVARERHNPNAGGSADKARLVGEIEELWLEYAL